MIPHSRASALASDPRRELVVSDWHAFLDDWLHRESEGADGRTAMIVPTPLMPHLLADWLERRARRTAGRTAGRAGLAQPCRWARPTTGCTPTACATFPSPTGSVRCTASSQPSVPRSGRRARGRWAMRCTEWSDGLGSRTSDGAVASTLHLPPHCVRGRDVPGPPRLPGSRLTGERRRHPPGGDLVIGSISACHGAVAVLRVGPATEGGTRPLVRRSIFA